MQDREIKFNEQSENILIKIENGKIWVEETDCPNRICKKMGKQNAPGEIIVCVPYRLLIQISGEKKSIEATTR